MRSMIIAILAVLCVFALYNAQVAREDLDELRCEVAILRGAYHDQAATMQHLTHPATIQTRTIDYILRQGEFSASQ